MEWGVFDWGGIDSSQGKEDTMMKSRQNLRACCSLSSENSDTERNHWSVETKL